VHSKNALQEDGNGVDLLGCQREGCAGQVHCLEEAKSS
jgi:hypothetical protein